VVVVSTLPPPLLLHRRHQKRRSDGTSPMTGQKAGTTSPSTSASSVHARHILYKLAIFCTNSPSFVGRMKFTVNLCFFLFAIY
jgi:hypothetical protein